MKIKMILAIPSLIFLPVFPIFAAEGTFEGEIGVTGMLTDIDGNKATLNQYRDIRDGVFSGLRWKYDTDDWFISGKAYDIGYDTQRYKAEGGKYGDFRAYIEYIEIPHNSTFDAKTFYSGAGTNNLTYTPRIPSVSSWNNFDYETTRKTYEAGFSLDTIKPLFIEFSVPHEEKTGIVPFGAAVGTSVSPGSSFVELPQSVDQTTNGVNVTTGYAKDPFFAAVSFSYSEFDNADSAQFFYRPTGTGAALGNTWVQDAYSLPPSNDAYRLAFKGSAKLPYNSQFSINAAQGKAESNEAILRSSTGRFGPVFNGEIDTNNLDLVLITNPVRFLKTKIDYKYYERDNKSDELTIDSATNELFGYQKDKFGIGLGWTLPAKFNLDTAYSNVKISRDHRVDLPETRDNIYSTELRWRGLDYMMPKLRYEWLQRSADHGDFTNIEAYEWRYDAAPKDQDTIKASIDFFPLTNLNASVGYKYKNVDYTDTILGLQSTKSNQVNLDAGYIFGKIATLNGYFDMELRKDYQFQRRFTGTNADPSFQNATNYNWDMSMKDKSYSWGASSEIYLVPDTVTLLLQYDNVNSNGDTDFTYFFAGALPAGQNNDTIDIGAVDDYRLTSYAAKVRYTPTKHYTFTLGYVYEQYKYNDAQLDNYLMVQGTNYLSGAYANPNYDAHIVFLAAVYKF